MSARKGLLCDKNPYIGAAVVGTFSQIMLGCGSDFHVDRIGKRFLQSGRAQHVSKLRACRDVCRSFELLPYPNVEGQAPSFYMFEGVHLCPLRLSSGIMEELALNCLEAYWNRQGTNKIFRIFL